MALHDPLSIRTGWHEHFHLVRILLNETEAEILRSRSMSNLNTSVLQTEKRCIFCGNKPNDKNREHVIPRWLISLTGDPKREWHLGFRMDRPDKPERRYAADQYVFPACESCNSRYSALEDRAKSHVEKLLNDQLLTAQEWDDLMDWFDKVRIGLWIGNMTLNKDWHIPNPNFYIDQRIAKRDRCLLVYQHPDPENIGLNFIGTMDPVFYYLPSVFMLVTNSLIFINVSYEFMLSEQMGFPYPRKTGFGEGEHARQKYVEDFAATYNACAPFLRFNLFPPKMAAYQAMLLEAGFDDEVYASLVANDYIKSKRLPGEPIKSQICTLYDGKPQFLQPDEVLGSANGQAPAYVELLKHCVRLLEFRHSLLDHLLGAQLGDRNLFKTLKRYNNEAIRKVQQ